MTTRQIRAASIGIVLLIVLLFGWMLVHFGPPLVKPDVLPPATSATVVTVLPTTPVLPAPTTASGTAVPEVILTPQPSFTPTPTTTLMPAPTREPTPPPATPTAAVQKG